MPSPLDACSAPRLGLLPRPLDVLADLADRRRDAVELALHPRDPVLLRGGQSDTQGDKVGGANRCIQGGQPLHQHVSVSNSQFSR